MIASRDIYAVKALSQIPRLLGNLDRNPFSPTYGCFHRDYWLDKTSDFPDAVRQFAVHALALVYKHSMPGNIYQSQPKVKDWAIAGLDFWTRIQHRDGSFDEFYPYERGWVGPTAFTTYTAIESYRLLESEMPDDVKNRIRAAILRAALFITTGESEEDHLANHYAMACLAVWKAYELLHEPALKVGYDRLWQGFLGYHNREEGWSREYDGVDPGYLSATVSFLGKIYQTNPDPGISEVLYQSVDFCSYFVYPNGFYAGSIGSRNTLHFYPHGFEIMAKTLPLAGSIAEKMLVALGQDKIVPPEIMSDRYVVYRVPEYLLAYLDYSNRPAELTPLPYERENFTRFFSKSRIYVTNHQQRYIVANLAKGGVVKVFDRENGELLQNDCGIIGRLEDGKVISSQWIDPDYQYNMWDDGWEVSGGMHFVPSNKLFNLLTNLVFRSTLLLLSWNSSFSHLLKGQIRKALILGKRPSQVHFQRRLQIRNTEILLTDKLQMQKGITFRALSIGDEFFVRYVPQSRYFQSQELQIKSCSLPSDVIQRLNTVGNLCIRQRLTPNGKLEVEILENC